MPSSYLFAVNNEGRVFGLSTTGTKWREFTYLGLEFKHLSAVPHFMWAVGGDRQVYVHVHGLDIPIRVKEEAYENERWLPLEGFSGRLLPTDRYHFSNQDGTQDRSREKIRLPSMAWQWEDDWHLETNLDGQPLDHDGWTYAVDFPATFYSKKQWKSCVRRRKWIRYRRYSALKSWCAISPLHKDPTQEPFIDVAVGGQSIPGGTPGQLLVWAITAHGRVMFRTGVSNMSPEGLRWTSISVPQGCDVTQISVGPTGLLWAIMWNGRALVRSGVTRESPTGEFWLEVAPPESLKLAQVSVGTNAVWAVTRDHRVWFRKGIRGESAGTNDELAQGSGWVEMVGNMALVSVSANDQVWAVGADDRRLYFRAGVAASELTGRGWRPVNARAQLSRTSSSASLGPRCGSLQSLGSSVGGGGLGPLGETSRSAPTPTTLRLWQREGSAPPRGASSQDSVASSLPTSRQSNEHLPSSDPSSEAIQEHCEGPRRRRHTAWSPVRSAGSVVGMEMRPDSDMSAFDTEGQGDSGVFGEGDDDGVFEADGDASWSAVEAGACCVDPAHLPNWFVENSTVPELEVEKPWRMKIVEELKNRSSAETNGFDLYEKAVETSSWVKSGAARCLVTDGVPLEDCLVELEWVGSDHGSLDAGTLTVTSPDRMHTKVQFSLSEITCVVCCSEPTHHRIAIHTPKLTPGAAPLKLEFASDTEKEDWMANLTLVCCQMFSAHGRPSAGAIWITTTLGDVFVFDPVTLEASQLSGEMYAQHLDVAGKTTPYETALYNGFVPGTAVTVSGSVCEDTDRFSINLQCASSKSSAPRDVAIHFNPRFEEGVIVRNAQCGENWGKEEKSGVMVLRRGEDFTVRIVCQEDAFKISINGSMYTYFEHRLKPHNITHLSINGNITLSKVVYESKTVVVPPSEMFWRQMGGHLRKVETCPAGITWGIGYDSTVWVYTGGWGGSFLEGLETSSDGIHPMQDTHSYFVYENQRWNPVTGYTSHGLPTDRYMWSDVTGKHKRTREKTKLLSRHWQWVTDWAVDFHAPGGVDRDGWQYAVDFPATYHGQKGFADYVRRRRWVRKAQLTTSGPWRELGSTRLVEVSLQVSNPNMLDAVVDVWAVAVNGDALYRKGVSASCPTGSGWEHVPSEQPLISISCGVGGIVWAVGRGGSAYRRSGVSDAEPTGSGWEPVESPNYRALKQVSVGFQAVWVLNALGQLSVRHDVTPDSPSGSQWQMLLDEKSSLTATPGFRHVSASPLHGEVWAVTAAGIVCRRHGVTRDNPAGAGWSYGVAGSWQHVSSRGCNIKHQQMG